jgi:hypothetical protein
MSLYSCRLATVLVGGRTGFEFLNVGLIRQSLSELTASLGTLSITRRCSKDNLIALFFLRFIPAVFLFSLLRIWHDDLLAAAYDFAIQQDVIQLVKPLA